MTLVRAQPHPDATILLDVTLEKPAVGHTAVDFQFRNAKGGKATWRCVFEHGESAEDMIYQLGRLKGWLVQIQKIEPE